MGNTGDLGEIQGSEGGTGKFGDIEGEEIFHQEDFDFFLFINNPSTETLFSAIFSWPSQQTNYKISFQIRFLYIHQIKKKNLEDTPHLLKKTLIFVIYLLKTL
jgi:hypothetical protein